MNAVNDKVLVADIDGPRGALLIVRSLGRRHIGTTLLAEKGALVPAGIKVVGEWSSLAGHRVFRLTESEDPKAFLAAAMAWTDLGKVGTYPVMPTEIVMKLIASKK